MGYFFCRKFLHLFLLALVFVFFFFSVGFVSSIPECVCEAGGIGTPDEGCSPEPAPGGSGCPYGIINYCGYVQPNLGCSGWCDCAPNPCPTPCTQGAKECTGDGEYRECVDGCNWIGGNSCGTSSCPADSCTGIVTYSDYAVACDNFCPVGDTSCTSCSCTPLGSATCNLANSCIIASCGGSSIQCHRTNAGGWQWDSSPISTSETSCNDGYDNNCDGHIDCQSGNEDPDCSCSTTGPTSPKLKFRQGTTSNYAAVLGENGDLDLKGFIITGYSGTLEPTGVAEFVVNNSFWQTAMVMDYDGNIHLNSAYVDNVGIGPMNSLLTDAEQQFLVLNSDGDVIMVVTFDGSLAVAGTIRQGVTPQ